MAAHVDEDHAAGHLAGKAHFVGHDHHRHALACELDHHIQHLAHHFGIQRRGGLVKQHDDRVHRQGAGNCHALLLATGELAGKFVFVRHQAHAVEHFEAPGFGLVCVAAQHLHLRNSEVLRHA